MSQDLSHAFGRPLTSSLRGLLPPRGGSAAPGEAPGEPTGPPDQDDVDLTAEPEDGDDELRDGELRDGEFRDGELRDGDVDGRRAPGRSGRPGGSRAAAPRSSAVRAPGPIPTASPRAAATGKPRRNGAPRAAAAAPERAATANRRWGRARVEAREHADLLVLLALWSGPADGRGVVDRLRADSGGTLTAPERTVYRTLHRLTRNRLLAHRADPVSGRPAYALTETGVRATRARVRAWRALERAVDAMIDATPDA